MCERFTTFKNLGLTANNGGLCARYGEYSKTCLYPGGPHYTYPCPTQGRPPEGVKPCGGSI